MIKRFFFIIVLSLALGGCIPQFGVGSNMPKGTEFVKGAAAKGYPNLPFYQKAKVLETFGSSVGYGGSAITSDSISKVIEFYDKNLGLASWEYHLQQKDKNNYVYNVNNFQYEGVIIINTAADGKKTAITLSVSKR